MRVSFTGPSGLTAAQVEFAERTLTKYREATEWTTGGARGLDTVAHRMGFSVAPDAVHRLVIPAAPFNGDVLNMGYDHLVRMPPAKDRTTAYRARNEKLVVFAERGLLVAFVRWAEFYRSGEWMTINIAKKRDVPVDRYVLP